MIVNELLAFGRRSDLGNGACTSIFLAGLKVCQGLRKSSQKGLFDGNAGKPRHPPREWEDEA